MSHVNSNSNFGESIHILNNLPLSLPTRLVLVKENSFYTFAAFSPPLSNFPTSGRPRWKVSESFHSGGKFSKFYFNPHGADHQLGVLKDSTYNNTTYE